MKNNLKIKFTLLICSTLLISSCASVKPAPTFPSGDERKINKDVYFPIGGDGVVMND